ncbi:MULTISPECIES: restriction endonuclease subunit S [unclassified Serratia (in: enterobacteria)]|uniref:restriction endonuclease subunit S n=1 Tax=unclassified Serratia (in: enterobacteria) TaxID=2647522 RepID=UPI0005032029|nr:MULTISPECIES: restriction endonuclease subunit S [unclassified Serratia (in: enterobacteria)]KFK92332.1 hypothetical protein JV45_21700 [Serratia sp. Ag2]KFK98825.1 hypothetical protein IV04_11690 [Serratia sp. Ag1]
MSEGKLPEGWVPTQLSALGHIVTGKTPSTKEPSNFGGDIPFIKPGDLELGGNIMTTTDTLTAKGLALVPTLPADSIVVTCIGNLGKVGVTTKRSASNQQINTLIPSQRLNVKFVYFQILTLKAWLESQSAATTIAIVNKSKFSKAPFKLPSISEQKIIAEKLDTLLAKVGSTKTRLEQIPLILKRFRQAVLSNAISGKLIRQNFEKKLTKLNSFVSIDIGSAFKSSEFSDDGIPLLRGQNIEPGALRWDDTKKFPIDKLKKHAHLFINEGDVILAMDRPIISSGLKVAKAKKSDLPCVLVQRVAKFKDFKNLNPEYLYLLLNDLSFINYIKPNQTGSDIPHISGKQILNFNCVIPPLPEQHEIVRRVEQLFAYADTIEKQVNNALSRVNNLTQSILAKAFRGELTAQWRAENPDLISGENSAAALLEKIKAERAANNSKKAARKKV